MNVDTMVSADLSNMGKASGHPVINNDEDVFVA